MQIGIALSVAAAVAVADAPPAPAALTAPENLFTAAQTALTDTSHVDTRSNWNVEGSGVRCLGGNNDCRFTLDTPLVAGRYYIVLIEHSGATVGTVKIRLGGDGSVSGDAINHDDTRPLYSYFRAADVVGNYLRVELKPAGGYDGLIERVRIFDLTDVHPSNVACNAFAINSDSILGNASSEFVTADNVGVEYNPLCWYLPGETYATMDTIENEPHPLVEPAVAVAANRISPLSAIADGLVGWSASAAGGARPLLFLHAADPGSGLLGASNEWDKDISDPENVVTGVAYAKFETMLAAMNALGPAHVLRAALTTLLTNNLSGVDYAVAHKPAVDNFVANMRTDTGLPSLPVVWLGMNQVVEVGGLPDYDDGGGLTYRATRMRAFQASLDQDADPDTNAISGVHFVAGPPDETYAWDGDGNGSNVPDVNGYITQVHPNAAGMLYIGQAMSAKVLEVLA
jgi:hypothetical protein